ncbi:RidA family protein [Marinibaculum pumilum]|uniref:RidA family protein n=1 Tax=Marinibaculum pumilum TaxID=1766165 RepID=A0ABV7KWS1_9PROT
MAGKIDARLKDLGIELPDAPAPAANYVPYTLCGNILYISGQVPLRDGRVAYTGKVGQDLPLEEGQAAARTCAINIIAQARAACGGDLDRVKQVLKLGGFVNALPDFTDHPKVINGASDLMVEVFGDAGRHARFAVGAGSLPLGCAVEVEAIFALRD